jgi:hypothetical protein
MREKKVLKPGETTRISLLIPDRPPDLVIPYNIPNPPRDNRDCYELHIWLDDPPQGDD